MSDTCLPIKYIITTESEHSSQLVILGNVHIDRKEKKGRSEKEIISKFERETEMNIENMLEMLSRPDIIDNNKGKQIVRPNNNNWSSLALFNSDSWTFGDAMLLVQNVVFFGIFVVLVCIYFRIPSY